MCRVTATRDKLIKTAFELFGRNGFHGIGLDQIIDTVGVSKQTFYNHFECKDDLVLAVLEHRHVVELHTFGELMVKHGGPSPREKLCGLFNALQAWMEAPEWKGCIFMTAAAEFPLHTEPAHQLAARHTREIVDQLQYLATLAGAKNPRTLAEQLSLLMDGAIAYRHATGEPGTIEIAKRLAKPLLAAELPATPVTKSVKPRSAKVLQQH